MIAITYIALMMSSAMAGVGFSAIPEGKMHAFCTGNNDGLVYFVHDLGSDHGLIRFNNRDIPLSLPPAFRPRKEEVDMGDGTTAEIEVSDMPGYANTQWLGDGVAVQFYEIGPTEFIGREESDSTTIYRVAMTGFGGGNFDRIELEIYCGL